MFVNGQIIQFYIIHVVVHTFKCKIPLYEMHISRLNILGAMDSTDIVRSSPLLHNNSKLHNILIE